MPPWFPRLAATAVLLRDGEHGPEVLLLRRHAGSFAAGAWVFQQHGRRERSETTAVRETWEETGVRVTGDLLPLLAGSPQSQAWALRRWFFLARVPRRSKCC